MMIRQFLLLVLQGLWARLNFQRFLLISIIVSASGTCRELIEEHKGEEDLPFNSSKERLGN